MPVKKYRSVEDMKAVEARPLNPANLRAAFRLAARCLALHPTKLPPGVHRHRSVEAEALWWDALPGRITPPG